MRRVALVCFLSFGLAGCISTQEMPLTPNSVRIDTSAQGYLFTDKAVPQTMRAAAKATIARGYTRFKLQEAAMSQGEVPISTTTQGSIFFATQTVQTAPAARSSATVVMFHDNELGAKDAFIATDILKQYPES